jgi:7-keto-8-aminopelargonate synthetase-like enzyme
LTHEIVERGKSLGIGCLYTEDMEYDGTHITINHEKLLNFGLCSYLGLENDHRIKLAAIEAIMKYGIHYSSSRSFVRTTLYAEFENLMEQIFEAPVALATSLSLGHQSVMPIVIEEGDAIILDQQVHTSVQDAALKMKALGVDIFTIRHNHMGMLNGFLEDLSPKYNKVWYLFDGVYSMYGDFAPLDKIVELAEKYPNFHMFADDAHGTGWIGKNGKGYVLNNIGLHPKLIVAASLTKAFPTGGGAYVFADKELCNKVKNCGASFVFSAPHAVPVLGAAIASAKIFLSSELELRQEELMNKVAYCQQQLDLYELPVISNPKSPIFFIGVGNINVGVNMMKYMMASGLYINLSVFPSVPENCSGMRFTITLHHNEKNIRKLVKALAKYLPKALKMEGKTKQDIYKAFKKVEGFENKMSEYVKA